MTRFGLRPWARKTLRRAYTAADAELNESFEETASVGEPTNWHYKQAVVQQSYSILHPNYERPVKPQQECSTAKVASYIQHVQRPGFIQAHGTMLLLEEKTLKIQAYGENLFKFLDAEAEGDQPVLGRDARTLFSAKTAGILENACNSQDLALVNPLEVATSHQGRPLYAILHKVPEGVIIDIEAIGAEDWETARAKAAELHMIAGEAIMRLKALPPRDIRMLCDTVVQDVRKITGYDRVMVYKFHEDEHGEVFAEAQEGWLPTLLGLHYPANDIPQANRKLFVEVKVRMITDMNGEDVKVIQDPSLAAPVLLSKSTLRGVAGCHKQYSRNMGLQATLAMAVVVKGKGSHDYSHLYGLVVCHHHSGARAISYPQRYAADFLVQAFAMQLSMELEEMEDLKERQRMQTQVVLWDMVARENPLGLIKQSPNIMDLIPSDGAVFMNRRQVLTIGTCPSQQQVVRIASWLLENEGSMLENGRFATSSLEMSGFDLSEELKPHVCGLLAVRIAGGDFLMWFRPGHAKTTLWAGAKDTHAVIPGSTENPRSSFEAWLEVAKHTCEEWDQSDLDAAQSLKFIIRDTLPEYSVGPTPDVQEHLLQERRNIQQQLTDVDRQLQAEMEKSLTPIVGLSGAGYIVSWNPKMAEITKMPREDVLQLDFVADMVQKSDQEKLSDILEGYADVDDDEPVEVGLMARSREDGPQDRLVVFLFKFYYHHDMNGNVLSIRMLGEDITWLKNSLSPNTDDEEYQQQLLNSNVKAFAIDSRWNITAWTPELEKLSGLKMNQVMGRRLIHDVLSSAPKIRVASQESLIPFEVSLVRALHGADTWNHELRFQTWDGKQMDTLMHIISRKDENGRLLGVTCYVQDMLEQRLAENALALKMVAETALKTKTMQLATLCHEIRNPLNGILSSIDFMSGTQLTHEQSELVSATTRCGRYLRHIVDDVLDLSKIEEGKLEVASELYSCAQILDTVLAQEVDAVQEKDLTLYASMDPILSGMFVMGDFVRVQQVVANFMRNAVDYTEKGWIEIKLMAEGAAQPGHFCFSYSVSDTGRGMSQAQLQELFQMPSVEKKKDRADESSPFSSMGLGLVVCCRIASLIGGTVSCSSQEGVGSCFTLTMELPIGFPPSSEPGFSGPFGNTPGVLSNHKGVIYTLVGEWSTPEEIAAATVVSPTLNRVLANSSSPSTTTSLNRNNSSAAPSVAGSSNALPCGKLGEAPASESLPRVSSSNGVLPLAVVFGHAAGGAGIGGSGEQWHPDECAGEVPYLQGGVASEDGPETSKPGASAYVSHSGDSSVLGLIDKAADLTLDKSQTGSSACSVEVDGPGQSASAKSHVVKRHPLGRFLLGSSVDDKVRAVEAAYRGKVRVNVEKEVVEEEEVAVLISLAVEHEVSGEAVASILHWSSVQRAGSLGENLRMATENAIREALAKCLEGT